MGDPEYAPLTGPPGGRPPLDPERALSLRRPLWLLAMLLLLVWAGRSAVGSGAAEMDYSAFKKAVAEGRVERVAITPDEVRGTLVAEEGAKAGRRASGDLRFRAVRVEDPKLVEGLEARGVPYTGVRSSALLGVLAAWLVPLLLFGGLWFAMARRMGQGAGGLVGVGRSRARLVAAAETGVDFDDVAGCEEAKAELVEVVDFLCHPDRYEKLGARIPKGVLLVGPPGTGKTLLARAVAGEAAVPFFELSGSDFIELFVGVGAARVRDLFEQAKAKAPCIVFIDELDAVGRQRGVHVGSANDEREQTLNQLLVELDGFQANQGVILLAATNRPDVLDPALLRPGRFDRQVVIDAPDRDGRLAILRVHARPRPLAPDVCLEDVARATPGLTGADLANALNEASLLAAREGTEVIDQDQIERAVEKVVAGHERKSRRLGEEQRRCVAVHEAGHALVALNSEHADPVYKLSIVPRGHAALGYTLQRPDEDRYVLRQSALLDMLAGLLGGRVAELLVFGEPSTGASDDLEKATQLARRMVTMYGMSEAIGPAYYGLRTPTRLAPPPAEVGGIDCSEETARGIDAAVRELLDGAARRAEEILTRERATLDRVAGRLLEVETLGASQLAELVGGGP